MLGRTLIEQIAAAEVGGAEEGITAEKTTKPFFRVTTLRVVSVRR